MAQKIITAVGIDVSKGKSTIAVRRPGGIIVLAPFAVKHNEPELKALVSKLKLIGEMFVSSWSIPAVTGNPLLFI